MPNYIRPKTSRCGKITELLSFSLRGPHVIFPSLDTFHFFLLHSSFPPETKYFSKYFFLFLLPCKLHIFVLQIFSFSKHFLPLPCSSPPQSYFSPPNTFSPLFLLCFSCPPNIFPFQIFSSSSFSSANQIFSIFFVEKFEQNPQFLYALFEELSWYSFLFLRTK